MVGTQALYKLGKTKEKLNIAGDLNNTAIYKLDFGSSLSLI